jgi:enoyl-CoA hydratase/carnithine racemase
MTLSPTTFRLQVADGVATITLDRPERLNALTFEVYNELRETFRSLSDAADVRAVVITGAGKGFCSGGDQEDIIARLMGRDMAGLLAFTRVTGALIQAIRECRRPVIGAINGTCVGAGAVIAAACDLRVAVESAKFGFIFPRVGLCGADMGAAYLLPRIVGLGNASELLFLGEIVQSPRMKEMGFLNRVTATADEALAQAQTWAKALADGPAFAHAMTKQMLESEHTMPLAAAIEAEAQAQAICMAHPDFATAHEAWKKKEPPRFAGHSPE